MHSTVLAALLLASAGCLLPASGLAQVSPPAPAEPRILYVAPDRMPELPRGGGLRALTAAVQHNLHYPVAAQRQGAQGLVDVAFTVLDDGRIINLYAQGVDYGCPEAATAAVLQLSPLKPGRQRGVPVPVRMKVTVQFVLDGPMGQNLTPEGQPSTAAPGTASPKTVPLTPGDTTRVYDLSVDHGPALPDGNGFYAVGRLVQQRLVLPPEVRAGLEGRVFVGFTVGVSGVVRDVRVLKPLSPAADAAACRAVAALPRCRPGSHHGQQVAVGYVVPVIFRSPNHVYNFCPGQRPRSAVEDFDSYCYRNMRVPAEVAAQQLNGVVGVGTVITPAGHLDSLKVLKSLCAACDAEALRLVRSLPPYRPGTDEADHPIFAREYLEVRMPARTPPELDSVHRVYTYVAQMPSLPGGGGTTAIIAKVQALVLPVPGLAAEAGGRVFISFVVGPKGSVYQLKVVKGLGDAADAAALAAVRRLPRLVSGRQNDVPVPVLLTVPVLVK